MSDTTRVYHPKHGGIRRYRKCRNCGLRFDTHESISLRGLVQKLRRRVKEIKA